MNETWVTMAGIVATGVTYKQTPGGVPVANFRMVVTERRFDRTAGEWVDGDAIWVTVVAWRGLAANVVSSLSKGDPAVVCGRLRLREWGEGEKHRCVVELEARVIGHDLGRGTSAFRWAVQSRAEQVAGRAGSVGPGGAAEPGEAEPAEPPVPAWIAAAVGVCGAERAGGSGAEPDGSVTPVGAAVLAAVEEVVDAVGAESGNEIVCNDRVPVG
ncbi:single-stranded DNA-binding protein [Kitasatospora sp. NPDC002227]|uniref:single-stranded DNA-binding protein n=1 Tax=Kitasatospora sp. NPDC002227 TaxID=3154773 RepID=UPI003318E130